MKSGGVPAAALLFLIAGAALLQAAAAAEDIYWEEEDDLKNEYLEVKEEDQGIRTALRRFKRDFLDLWNPFAVTSAPESQKDPNSYDDHADEENTTDRDDEELESNFGSGAVPEREPELREKTLRVSFVVMEPYQLQYSNRDSEQFQNLSKSLADAVNQLFESLLPGTQRASLVRIQSRVSDEFSCKVTLDISTIGFDDTDRITETLRNHIRNQMKLGSVTVSDTDFSAMPIDPDVMLPECQLDEFQCRNGRCVKVNSRCDSVDDCGDGSDEESCSPRPEPYTTPAPVVTTPQLYPDEDENPEVEERTQDETEQRPDPYDESENEVEQGTEDPVEADVCKEPLSCFGALQTYCPSQRCDGVRDCPRGDDELYCDMTTTRDIPKIGECPTGMISCDNTRCIEQTQLCDNVQDCHDGTDEKDCGEQCGVDDFRCDNGKCIPGNLRCNRIVDCENQEDEINCDCREDEFRCVIDGSCIERRKKCDGLSQCKDGSDEQDCISRSFDWSGSYVCQSSGRFRCGDGTCVSILLRCDGYRDCPKDGADELECPCSAIEWQCDHGTCIKRTKRCDGRVDCPTDRSDERNCLASGYFRCRTGKYIPQSLRCNRQYDCPPGDYSDEKNCPCGEGDFKCDNGYCIPASKHCDRTHDCQDGSDERHCRYAETICMASEYKCSNGKCVQADARCNGTTECTDWSDEIHCPCKRDQFRCLDGTCINIALRCDGYRDCQPKGEDENNCGAPPCPANAFQCSTGACGVRCDGNQDCDDGADEDGCDFGEDDCNHHCDGTCLDDSRICDGKPDCSDGSDETNCDRCDGPNDFRCNNGECIKDSLHCNGLMECSDGSDEQGCQDTIIPVPVCNDDQFQCRNGACIDRQFLCDSHADCTDNSDEENCSWYAIRPYRSSLLRSEDPDCHESEYTCYDGACIPHVRRCDNIYDCHDFSDEQNCYNTACDENQWQCASGQCIPNSAFCDGIPNCNDNSDEVSCPTPAPIPYPPSSRIPGSNYGGSNPSYPGYPNYPGYGDYPYARTTTTSRPLYTTTGYPIRPPPQYPPSNADGCDGNKWRCENGPCIGTNHRCNGHVDCPYDDSDELDCPPDSPVALNLRTYPKEQTVRYGGDVVFQCRDEGPQRAPVRWTREGGRPLKPGSSDRNGRLELFRVSPSDSGVYVCQATKYLGNPGSELRVTLHVDTQVSTQLPPFFACKPNEATCANGHQCIPKTAVCDGRHDCSDGSDEDECNQNGLCEPNQFQCANHRCVLKTWLCDSEDDCGDNSDEQNCGTSAPGQCLPIEYSCRSGDQCIPKSFHCDGHNDCIDRSDEIGCAKVSIRRQPQPQNVRLNPGDTLTLTCEAVGIPTPLISWRLNWGHVPEQCRSTSIDGVGTLVCPNIQSEHSGAYSCEAINNKGTAFAAPDSIVFVNRTSLCPPGYFNSEANSENDCIRCFCFGESTQCKSADLFTYNMPTPLGEGGTRLLGVKPSYTGEIQVDSQPITDLYYYQPLRNGAMVTKLDTYASRSSHPYITLPESYNGNQLTSYGGYIKYRLQPHAQRFAYDNNVPDVIIKGKYETLVHYHPQRNEREKNINARLTPENWQKASPGGLVQASREDIMMALDNIETIMLRSDLNGAGANITDFIMESAQHINVGLGAASLVEECSCPPGYEGLSCQKCASGYGREKSGPWLGNCVREQRTCPPGEYGDPDSGYGCRRCPCPLTNRENQFASTCSLGPNGRVICDCMVGYQGANCEVCAPGYVGNPTVPGDTCKPQPTDNCNPVGTVRIRLPDRCECKENVQGRYCDQCNDGSFYLSEDFRHGCAQCFCSGITEQCTSSNLRRKTSTVLFNVPQIVDQVKVYNSTPAAIGSSIRYNAPVETNLKPIYYRGEIALGSFDRSRPTIYYWSLPISFAGDKVTSYGGFLHYTLRHVPGGQSSRNNAADVQLISDNHLTFHYFGNFAPSGDGFLNASVQFLEKGWQRPDGKEVQRESLLQALADVKTILIKATYTTNTQLASLVSASIDTAEPNGDGPQALHVEQCVCPLGYLGTSCEDCAPGYTRSPGGLYLGLCKTCDCNGHSDMCDPETGVCYDCADNTDGENCELCKPGYERDRYDNCVASYRPPSTDYSCNCDPRGELVPCDNGRCICKQNVEGDRCDRCRPGSFGLDLKNADGCIPCYCSGVTKDCYEGVHYTRVPIPAPIFGENYGGYTIMDLNAESVINDQFVPATNESELMYVFSYPPNEQLYWSLPVFPGNRVLSYGGSLSLTQRFEGENNEVSSPGVDVVLVGDEVGIYWMNPEILHSGQGLSYKVPLKEDNWFILNTNTPVSRQTFMDVLKNLRRVLVRATITESNTIQSTSIADVSMDTAADIVRGPPVKGVEVCICPEGHTGTSCESCNPGYYKDQSGVCRLCSCNGHDCQLGPYGTVVCNCRPPYTGRDCSSLGLVMELHPTVYDDGGDPYSLYKKVKVTCKYRAPEPLTIQFYYEGKQINPPKYYNESRLDGGGWHSEHEWSTIWDTRHTGHIIECHTITRSGSTLGMLTSSLPEPVGDSSTNYTTRPPPPQSTVVVRITSPTIKIQEVGGSVNFTCQARSRLSQVPLTVKWSKDGGYLPLDRSFTDDRSGLLIITNVQVSDSGRYVCQARDGVSMEEAAATLQVPGNEMSVPTVEINPSYKEYYEGDRVELECIANGNPTPRITWQRATSRPLPRTAENFDAFFVIERASEEDSGEYRCIATNTAGSVDRTAVITIHPRPSYPSREKLTVSPSAVNIAEGQSTRVVCTGTANVPSGSIGWIRQDGTELLENVHSESGVLYVDGARPDNQGVYVCQTTSSEVSAVPVLITIVPQSTPPPGEQPQVTVPVSSVKIPTGGSQVIDCNPSGYPLPLVKWKKHESQFGPSTSQRDNSLVIANAQEDDQGYYVCEGTVDNTPVTNVYVFVEIERREPPQVEIWPQGEQAVPLGGQFEFHCRIVSGIPEPYITWDRNGGRPLSSHTQIQPQNVLKFEKIEVNDEGEYTCTARNDAGTNSASAILKVRSPPEIVITPNYVTVHFGDPINIECRASGYPEPEVSIRKVSPDYRDITPTSLGSSALRVTSSTDRDEGTYMCRATSPAGTFEEQFVINVERGDGGDDGGGSGEDPSLPQFPEPDEPLRPDSLIAIEGEDTTITCNTSDSFIVQWSRGNGQPLQSNAYQIGNVLRITGTSKNDAGYYECAQRNRNNGELQQTAFTALEVLRPPRITLRPSSQTVQPGQSPTVECDVDGDEVIEVSWQPVTKPFSRRVEARESTLIFHQIEVEDAGQYQCFAKSRIANATAVAEVKVNEELSRPPLESHDNEQHAHVGAGVHLSCNVSARNLRIRWTKDGRSLPRSISQKKDGSLFINRAQKSDSGHYVCIIQDQYGGQTANYINLHIEGSECFGQFRCYDDSGCVDDLLICDGFNDCSDGSDEENCLLRDKRLSSTLLDLDTNHFGTREEVPALVSIDQPRRAFRVGENVEVLCRMMSRDVSITWAKVGTNQFVDTRNYGDGSMLLITGVEESDASAYRCTGRDVYGRSSFDDFILEVTPGTNGPSYPLNEQDQVYTAKLQQTVDLPCIHNLDGPVSVEWRKEYTALPSNVKTNEPNLHLEQVTESDAGTYICRVTNSRAAVEARAILRVDGVIPSFDGNAWLSLPKLKDAYSQFDIEVSLKPAGDMNGLILYNSQNQGREGDYIALQLLDGVPQFILETGTGPIMVSGDRPLTPNTWHTIRINWIGNKVTMDVDNTPFIKEWSDLGGVLDLEQPLYIGGVPDVNQLPNYLSAATPYIGCVSMLILGREEVNIMVDAIEKNNVKECESCAPNLCFNNGVCQESRNERGYVCLCPAGFAGQDCSRTGEACRPGLCGPGKCTDTADGYKCACPVTYTGKRCEVQQSIEYPAFTGNAFLAVTIPRRSKYFRMAMKVKASQSPIPDGIIMYCAESPRGYGGFTSLAVRNGRLEFRYDLGDGSGPVILTSSRPLQVGEWTEVQLSRLAKLISMNINMIETVNGTVSSRRNELILDTPLYVGGYDDSIILNNNTGVRGGFSGCIKDVSVFGKQVDIVNKSIKSANIQECTDSIPDRGDIPENEMKETTCFSTRCRNGGYCRSSDAYSCTCPPGFSGQYCENKALYGDPCAANPCRNGGTCRRDLSKGMNYTCDCPLGFAGGTCQMRLELLQTVGFNGNGYLELPGRLLTYDNLGSEPAIIALAVHTTSDGVLLYQREVSASPGRGDYVLLRVENGKVKLEWDLGSGTSTIVVEEVMVSDGDRHQIIAKLFENRSAFLSVDGYHQTGESIGFSSVMNADSNIYIGGIPDPLNINRYRGLNGCFDHVELMSTGRGLNLGENAVAARNTQRCKD